MKTLKELTEEYYEDIETGKYLEDIVPTHWSVLNNLIYGFQPSSLMVLAGRPSMGKTAMAVDMLIGVADQDHPATLFSIESSEREIFRRMYTNLGADKELLETLPIHIEDTGGITTDYIRQTLKNIPSRVAAVDYLQLMRPPEDASGTRAQAVGAISRDLKQIAKEFDCTVLALSQLNRGVEYRENKRPISADLRESGDIEQDADQILMLYREDVYREFPRGDGVTEILVRKHRDGPTGHCRLIFSPKEMKFFEIED